MAESFANIVEGVRSLLAFSIIGRIPLRGAISIAPSTLLSNQWPREFDGFKDSLFAKAFNDAATAEKNQEWCGCEITGAAIECYRKNCGQFPLEKTRILSYPIPRKEGQSDGYVVDWVNHQQVGIDARIVNKAFAEAIVPPNNPAPDEWEEIKRKLANTLEFVKRIRAFP